MRRRGVALTLIAAVLGTVLSSIWAWAEASGYQVNIVLPSATNIVEGGSVQVNGLSAGKVESIEVRDRKAMVRVSLDSDFAPLHDGTSAQVEWKASLSERIIQLRPGPATNAEIPDDGMLRADAQAPVEMDQVLAALDPETRQRLSSLVQRLQGTVGGEEPDLNRTLRTAGPAVQSLGQVLDAVGTDGPAIRSLVTQLSQMTGAVAARQSDLQGTVQNLSQFANGTAAQREQLRASLRELPPTLRTARSTLDTVPGAVDQSLPLLQDLRPAAAKLPQVARNLSPLLSDLRPATAELKPTLESAQGLLARTPAMLDSAHAVLPGAKNAVDRATPALSFLRPYTPELTGWLANWGSATANRDSYGNYARIWVQGGAGNVNANPGVMPPGVGKKSTRVPGELEGQPWTDATGSGMR